MKVFSKTNMPFVLGAFGVVLLGVLTGYVIFSRVLTKATVGGTATTSGLGSTKDEVGMLDENVDYDNAVGTLTEGGIGNEGTHHLVREGGPTKDVYLTSSVIDLQSYVGKNVEVWGQTLSSKKAGWLMDVAKIKIVK